MTLLHSGWRETIILHVVHFYNEAHKHAEGNLRTFGNQNECAYSALAAVITWPREAQGRY